MREDQQVGLEETPEEYINRLVAIFREVKRCLKPEGTLWVNIGDSYAGSGKGRYADGSIKLSEKSDMQKGNIGSYDGGVSKVTLDGYKPKDLIGIPWMLAFALRQDGWYLRQDIIWSKPNPMPESVKDRCTRSHEYVFLLSKSQRYYFDHTAMLEDADPENEKRYKSPFFDKSEQDIVRPNSNPNTGGMKPYTGKRNRRDVWSIVPSHYAEAHFATFPEELIEPMVLAGCPENGIVLDPFLGSGTTALVAIKNRRQYVGIELNPSYVSMAKNRISAVNVSLF